MPTNYIDWWPVIISQEKSLNCFRIPNFQPEYAGIYKCEGEIARTTANGYVKIVHEGGSIDLFLI